MMSGFDTDNGASGLSHTQRRAIVLVAQACAAFSFMGSAVIVVANFRFKQLRTYSFQLVVWLAVCDLVVNLSFFLGTPSDRSGLCYAQGILQRFFQVALIQWTLLIAQSLLVLSSKTRTFEGDKRMRWNHLWAWGVSTVLTIGPLSTESFGETESCFCGVDSGDSWNAGSLWRAVFLAGVFVSMVVIVWAYVEVVKTLGRAQKNVFGLSLQAAANQHKEHSSTKTRQQDVLETDRKSSRWFSIMSRPASVKPAENLTEPIDRSEKAMKIFVGGRDAPLRSNSSLAAAAAAAAQEVARTSRKRSSRSDSLWKRMLLGSIVEDVEGERNASPNRERQQERHENCPSPPSSISYTRSNSNISVKDWLWSTSRDLGLFGENDSLGESSEEEGVANVLWLSGMDSPTRRRMSSGVEMMKGPVTATTTAPPKRLPTSQHTEQENNTGGGAGDGDGAIFASTASSLRMPKITKRAHLPSKVISTAGFNAAGGAVAAASAAVGDSNTRSPVSSPAHGRDVSHIDPPVTAATASNGSTEAAGRGGEKSGGNNNNSNINKNFSDNNDSSNNLKGPTAMLAPPMPTKSRLANRVANARGFVRRMSSIDADHGDVVFGNNVVRSGRSTPADRGTYRLNRSMSGKFATPTGMSTRIQAGSAQPSPTNVAPEKNMDRFISRIKWYPVIYVLCWAFTLINGTYTIAVGQSNASFALVLLATFTSRLQGMLNFICYGLNDKLKQAWLQDFFYRRAVGSCCRALWCCCFGPCYHGEDDDQESDDGDAEIARQTNDAAQDSSGESSVTGFSPADDMENGAALRPGPRSGTTTVATSAPVVHETPPRSTRTTSRGQYATPEHERGEEGQSLAPARPERPSRKVPSSVPRQSARKSSSTRRRRKKATSSTITNSAVAAAAAGVRRQRALVAGRVRTHGRRNGATRKKMSTRGTDRAVELANDGEHQPDSSSRNRRPDRVERASDSSTRKRDSGAGTSSAGVVLTQALPISVSMPVKSAARKPPRRRAAGAARATPGRLRERNCEAVKDVESYWSSSSSDRKLSFSGFQLGANSSSEDTDDASGGSPKRRGARRSRA